MSFFDRVFFDPPCRPRKFFGSLSTHGLPEMGDLHAKNLSIVENRKGQYELSPIYDIPSTAPYGDKNMAILLSGKRDGLSRRKFLEFAHELGISAKIADRVLREFFPLPRACWNRLRKSCPFDSHRLKQLTKVLKNRRLSLLP